MTSPHRTEFFNRVCQALGSDPGTLANRQAALFSGPAAAESWPSANVLPTRSPLEQDALLEKLAQQAVPLNLQVTPVDDLKTAARHIAALVRDKTPEWGTEKSVIRWSDPYLDDLDLETALADQGVTVSTTAMDPAADPVLQRQAVRERTIAAFMGVTTADFCLAETATLVLRTYPHQGRGVSLVPAIHVAVIPMNRIMADLSELYALLAEDSAAPHSGLTRHMVLISGPSKTADIELTMVHGAHGPREMHIFVVRS